MINLKMLEAQDVIEADDFARQLGLDYVGQSDYIETTSPYGGGRINRLGWIKASEVCPHWVGKTVGEFNKGLGKLHNQYHPYEFIRGAIPESHQEPN